MFSIVYDGGILWDPRDESRPIRDASAKISAASKDDISTGELTFTLQEDHPDFERLSLMGGLVELLQDDQTVFRGRIVRDPTDMYLSHAITVESVLTCLNDSVIPPFDFPGDFAGVASYQAAAASGNVVEYFLGLLLDQHNAQVSNEQKLYCGTVTVTDPNNYIARSRSSYSHTIDVIKEALLDTLGGWMVLRYTAQATYIDYLASFTATNSQSVEFAKNLTSFERELDGADVFNAILPTGANGLTISSLSDGDLTADQVKDGAIIYSRNGRARFRHKITKIVDWPDVTVAANLLAKASAELEASGGAASERISCSAIDLSFSAGSDIESFRVGRMTTVKSDPHGVDTAYPLTEISIPDLRDPGTAEITLGNVAATISAALHR